MLVFAFMGQREHDVVDAWQDRSRNLMTDVENELRKTLKRGENWKRTTEQQKRISGWRGQCNRAFDQWVRYHWLLIHPWSRRTTEKQDQDNHTAGDFSPEKSSERTRESVRRSTPEDEIYLEMLRFARSRWDGNFLVLQQRVDRWTFTDIRISNLEAKSRRHAQQISRMMMYHANGENILSCCCFMRVRAFE